MLEKRTHKCHMNQPPNSSIADEYSPDGTATTSRIVGDPAGRTGHRIRQEFSHAAKDFSANLKSPTCAAIIIAAHGGACLISLVASAAVFRLGTLVGLVVSAPLVLFVGTRFRALSNILHEANHRTLCRSQWNDRFGHFVSIALFTNLKEYREEHSSHHQYLGTDKDEDFTRKTAYHFDHILDKRTLIHHALYPLTGAHLSIYFPNIIQPKVAFDDPIWVTCLRIPLNLSIITMAFLSPFLLLMILASLYSYSIIQYWMDAVDHGGLLKAFDSADATRNFVIRPNAIGWMIARLFFPRVDHFHLIHHWWPGIPVERLADMHRLLLERSADYRAITESDPS
jgi:fatty acid desaturase